MNKKIIKFKLLLFSITVCNLALILPAFVLAQDSGEKIPIVVDGDHVEYFNEEKKIIAKGNVRIEYKDSKLTADSVVVYSQTKDIVAEGNVRLEYEKGILEGNKILYNFANKTGSIVDAKIETSPFYSKSPEIKKVSERELVMRRGYITTCDLADPHWRIVAKKVQIFPEDRIVAKDASIVIGNTPIITLPQYIHLLNDKRPRVTVVPGKDREWGYFMLTAWRYYINENAKGRVHLDYRERKDFASGIDFFYKPKDMGEGLLRTYYMNERAIESNRIWQVDSRDTKEKERFRIQWRHKWQIDPATNILWQYNKIKDSTFLEDYFRREHDIDSAPTTYTQFTHAQNLYSVNVFLEKRVNRFYSTVEKLPQIKFETVNFKIGENRFYFKTENDLSNLVQKSPGGAAFDDTVNRFDTFNKFSYPTKVAFISVSPYLGMRNTYYSLDIDKEKNQFREVLYSGVDLSTRFFRIYNVKGKFLGMDVDMLRHVINPTLTYAYIHEPSISSSELYNFDSIDSISKQNSANLALENKLQTKTKELSADLARHILSSDYYFEGRSIGGRFSDILKSELEIRPKKGLRIDLDTDYDRKRDTVFSHNTEFYIEKEDKFSVGLGHRYLKDSSNQFTSDVFYRINPKWKARVYERFDFTGGGLKEQQYIVSRDLHCWLMEVSYNVDRDRGETIWLSFKLKAFPEMGFDFDNSYHQPKAGSQGY